MIEYGGVKLDKNIISVDSKILNDEPTLDLTYFTQNIRIEWNYLILIAGLGAGFCSQDGIKIEKDCTNFLAKTPMFKSSFSTFIAQTHFVYM